VARTVAATLGVTLALATVAGVLQARALTRLRLRALSSAQDRQLAEAVRTAAARATLLRASLGALTIALLALGSALAS
jgi:hypothetical protein